MKEEEDDDGIRKKFPWGQGKGKGEEW
jgi:hypothetical protein